jgi:hypothetical protein
MSLDSKNPAFQYADPKQTIRRNLQIKVDDHQFQLKAVVTLPTAFDISHYSDDAAQLLRDVFGICLRSDSPRPDPEIASFGCENASNVSRRIVFPEVDGSTYTVSISRPLPPSLEILYRPFTYLADSLLVLPDDTISIEALPAAPIQSVAQGYKKVGTVFMWDATSNFSGENWRRSRQTVNLLTISKDTSDSKDASESTATSTQEEDVRSSEPSQPPTPVTVVQRVRWLEKMLPQKIRDPIRTILSAIPFLWFLWLLGRYCRNSDAQVITIRSVVLTFLTLHLTIIAIILFQATVSTDSLNFLRDLRLSKPFMDVMKVLASVTYINPFLLIGMAMLVKPLFRAFRRNAFRPATNKSGKFFRAIAWFFFCLAVPSIPVLAVWSAVRINFEKQFLSSVLTLAILLAA